MVIVYGTRFYGRADAIEGVGHVTCRFVHIMFVPLIPIETVFLVDEDRGMKLPFSFKAAMSGWLRGGALLTGIGSLIGGVVNFAEGEVLLGAVLTVVALASFGAFPLFGLLFGSCSGARRAELMTMLGIDPSQVGASQDAPIQIPYGQAPQGPQQPGVPQPAGGFGQPYPAPPYGGHNYGPPAQGYGASYGSAPNAYGAPPPQGYGAPQGYGSPQAYGAPAQGNAAPQPFGAPYGAAPQGQGAPGYGAPPQGYGPPGYDPNRR